jgi:hypothetical protein
MRTLIYKDKIPEKLKEKEILDSGTRENILTLH